LLLNGGTESTDVRIVAVGAGRDEENETESFAAVAAASPALVWRWSTYRQANYLLKLEPGDRYTCITDSNASRTQNDRHMAHNGNPAEPSPHLVLARATTDKLLLRLRTATTPGSVSATTNKGFCCGTSSRAFRQRPMQSNILHCATETLKWTDAAPAVMS